MRTVLIFIILLNTSFSYAQIFQPDIYPKGYFRNPLNIPISLSGNFGELRPNHYHMGLDLRTNKVENLPVHSAAEGFISRVKIEPGGFGRAIYIQHPNGFTSLYAHLNAFTPALDNYIKQRQYELKSWQVDLEIPPDRFPVKKGQFIANSGNTGGSQAPHLHFEIRRTSDEATLNPLLFGFPVPDKTSPVILRLAVYDRTKSVYEQLPRLIALRRQGNKFVTSPATISVSSPKVSFAIGSYDTQSGSTNQNGIFQAELYSDEQPIIGFRLDDISYGSTRYMNAHIDYKTRANGGPYLQHLSQLPGYSPSIYKGVSGDGVIDLSAQTNQDIAIIVSDANGNKSTLNFKIVYDGGSPDPVVPVGKKFAPGLVEAFESDDCEFFLGEKSIYDSVHIRYDRLRATDPLAVSYLHAIGYPHIPLQQPMRVRIKPDRPLSASQIQRTIIQRTTGTRKEVQKVEWNNGWASASFREFGNFQLLIDDESPVITPIGITNGANLAKASRIVFTIRDNNNAIRNFQAQLDGSWLRFTNDKGRSFIYTFDEKCPRGEHELVISIEDEAGNRTVESFRFVR